jgi:hypothetical protein
VGNTTKNTIYTVSYFMSCTAPIFTKPINTEQSCVEKFRIKYNKICLKMRKVRVPFSRSCSVFDRLFLVKKFYIEFRENPTNDAIADTKCQMWRSDKRTEGRDFYIRRSLRNNKTQTLRRCISQFKVCHVQYSSQLLMYVFVVIHLHGNTW